MVPKKRPRDIADGFVFYDRVITSGTSRSLQARPLGQSITRSIVHNEHDRNMFHERF